MDARLDARHTALASTDPSNLMRALFGGANPHHCPGSISGLFTDNTTGGPRAE